MEYRIRSSVVAPEVTLFRLYSGEHCLTHRDVHQLWQDESSFALFYAKALLLPGYAGFCWETEPVTKGSLDREHQFVVVKSESHERIRQNPTPFQEHFDTGELAVAFPNLGKNGIMIAPTPDQSFDGGSLASFLATAPGERMVALWALTGREMEYRLGSEPIWISTAGLGVSWLHVRLDTRPKYYRYAPYRQKP